MNDEADTTLTKQQCPLLLQMKPPPAVEASKKQQKEAVKCENKERYKNLRQKIELTPFEHQSRQLQSKMPYQKHQAAAATATAAVQDE
jgi:folylpolyglutamate synthase/dihydropteroate synthase